MTSPNRRQFVQSCAAALASGSCAPGLLAPGGNLVVDKSFSSRQEMRRKKLWKLLGDLPWYYQPAPPKVARIEKHEGYTLERLVLDLKRIEFVPAWLLIPDRRKSPAAGLLYIHWHGGIYDLGKEQLLRGVDVQPAYAPACAEKGLVTLAIDSWCFGERKHDKNGKKERRGYV